MGRKQAGEKECRVLSDPFEWGGGALTVLLEHLLASQAKAVGDSCHTRKAGLWLKTSQLGHSQKALWLLIA